MIIDWQKQVADTSAFGHVGRHLPVFWGSLRSTLPSETLIRDWKRGEDFGVCEGGSFESCLG